MFEEKKVGKTMAVLAAIAAIGVGGAGIASATVGGPGNGSEANTEKEDTLTGPEADRASAAAEKATGGKATEVDREDASSDKESGSQDAEDKGEFQTPADTAYEVEVDKGGKEIDVYLDKDFQVIATDAGG